MESLSLVESFTFYTCAQKGLRLDLYVITLHQPWLRYESDYQYSFNTERSSKKFGQKSESYVIGNKCSSYVLEFPLWFVQN
jgi:hypothetical protein